MREHRSVIRELEIEALLNDVNYDWLFEKMAGKTSGVLRDLKLN
jgi:hypothetical protein